MVWPCGRVIYSMKRLVCTPNTAFYCRLTAASAAVLTLLAVFWVLGVVLSGCAPGGDAEGPPFNADILPPTVIKSEVVDERRIRFTFDEPAAGEPEGVHIEPSLPVESVKPEGNTILVSFAEAQKIAENYVMRLKVKDKAGNSLSFLYKFSGWNPRVPRILINELTPRGSKAKPDAVELLVMSEGNIGGVVFTVGVEGDAKGEFVFPLVEVKSGDFIVMHTKPQGIPEEVNETAGINVSGGRLATDTARDFWMPEAPGLPGNNGAAVLYSRRRGKVLDAVIWSSRADNPDDEYLGWTRESFKWASALAASGAWQSSGEAVLPSEAVQAEGSTATRSICRGTDANDTDTPSDWHIVPTRGASFGAANTDDIYRPK